MDEKREKIIKIRVSPEELETLKFNSTKVQLAEWMRETCLNPGQVDLVRDLVQPEPVDPALLLVASKSAGYSCCRKTKPRMLCAFLAELTTERG